MSYHGIKIIGRIVITQTCNKFTRVNLKFYKRKAHQRLVLYEERLSMSHVHKCSTKKTT